MEVLLPPEIQREIFELAIQLNHADAQVKLSLNLVAHHVHFWTDQAFYRAVTISTAQSAARFLGLVDLKPPDFFTRAVKVLVLVLTASDTQTARILSACRGLESLAFWAGLNDDSVHHVAVGQLPLRRLSLRFNELASMFGGHMRPSWHSSLTHLDLAFDDPLPEASYLHAILEQLPGLTHLALARMSSEMAHARAVTESCLALEVLLIVDDAGFGETALSSDNLQPWSFDRRIVGISQPVTSVTSDWVGPYLGLEDSWSFAEQVVTERVKKVEGMESVARTVERGACDIACRPAAELSLEKHPTQL
ncbi:hypothetical protein C8R46DRAFT_421013 [Mycena filopes]|nr:hypothetical protein C8R46DRAFT_421013 [Mycena filopes]